MPTSPAARGRRSTGTSRTGTGSASNRPIPHSNSRTNRCRRCSRSTEPDSVDVNRVYWLFASVEEKGQMSEPVERNRFWNMYQDLKAGRLSRRQFIERATALGVGLPITTFILNSVRIGGAVA